VKRESRTPIVTVIRRGSPGPPTRPVAVPTPAPAASAPAPATAPTRANEQRVRDREARLAARAAPHAHAIRRLLDEASAANGGTWPRHVHVSIAEVLALPRSVVWAFLGTLRSRPGL
jgi:hypothetical protein